MYVHGHVCCQSWGVVREASSCRVQSRAGNRDELARLKAGLRAGRIRRSGGSQLDGRPCFGYGTRGKQE
jgi:hypothetical protein